MAKRVGKVILNIILYTAFMFDLLLIFYGIGGTSEGKYFLQGIITTLENGKVSFINFLTSVFIAVFLTYMSYHNNKNNAS